MPITLRQRRRLLWAANVLAAAGILATLAWALWMPPSADADGTGKSGELSSAVQASTDAPEPLTAYASVWSGDIRRPLYDPAPIKPKAIVKPKPKLTVTLTGTAVDPDFSCAFFRLRSGKTVTVQVGQTIEGENVELLEIHKDSAKIKFHGEVMELKAQKATKRGRR